LKPSVLFPERCFFSIASSLPDPFICLPLFQKLRFFFVHQRHAGCLLSQHYDNFRFSTKFSNVAALGMFPSIIATTCVVCPSVVNSHKKYDTIVHSKIMSDIAVLWTSLSYPNDQGMNEQYFLAYTGAEACQAALHFLRVPPNPSYQLLLRDLSGRERWLSKAHRLSEQGVTSGMVLFVLIPQTPIPTQAAPQPTFRFDAQGSTQQFPSPTFCFDGQSVASQPPPGPSGPPGVRPNRVSSIASQSGLAVIGSIPRPPATPRRSGARRPRGTFVSEPQSQQATVYSPFPNTYFRCVANPQFDVDIRRFYVELSDYERQKKIGRGSFGNLYSAREKRTGAIVAVDRKSTRLNSSHRSQSRMPSSA
jgi:hypothetical protein